jgi:hypothetical protein
MWRWLRRRWRTVGFGLVFVPLIVFAVSVGGIEGLMLVGIFASILAAVVIEDAYLNDE